MTESLQIFISYKRENHSFAQMIYELLSEWKFIPWLDTKRLDAGYQPEKRSGGWAEQITEALESSQLMLAIVTSKSLESKVVQAEWYAAWEKNIPIFFLRLDHYDQSKMNILYRPYQYIDCATNSDNGIKVLKEKLTTFRTDRQILTLEITDRARQTHSLNEEIIKDLEQLKNETALVNRLDTLIDSTMPSKSDETILRDRIYHYWLNSVLKPSLQASIPFDIALSLQADAVIKHQNLGTFELGGSINIYRTYKALKTFLIMGEPGSGKTVMLLQLATKLLLYEKQDMPLILNLSSWNNEAVELEDWLIAESEKTYRIRSSTIRYWLTREKLILLLDGLDEINEEVRAERIQRINKFHHNNPNIPIVICTRLAEYSITTKRNTKLDLPHALRLEALNKAQIRAYLDQPEFHEFLLLYENDVVVQDLAQIPFLLTTMAYTYKGEHLNQLQLKGTNNRFTRLKHLFDFYIRKQLKSDQYKPLKYTNEQVRKYLEWIAVKTTVYGTVFRPENITIEWFRDDEEVWRLYKLISRDNQYAVSALLSWKLPWPLDDFIQQMTERQIMRPMGGGHVFRHDYLRQSFLGTIPGKAQILLLIQDFLNESHKETAIASLLEFGEAAVPELLNNLQFRVSSRFGSAIIETLRKMGDSGIEYLINALNDVNQNVCSAAVWVLGEIGSEKAVRPLIERLNSGGMEFHRTVKNALFSLGENSVEPLIELLNSNDLELRTEAIELLGRLRDIRALKPLIMMLKDPNDQIRRYSVMALAKFHDVRVVEPLISALKDSNSDVVDEAIDALRIAHAIEPLIKALDEYSSRIRKNVAIVLGHLGDSRAVDPLIAQLKDKNVEVRCGVIEALGHLGDSRAVDPLIAQLKDKNVEVRCGVIEALGHLGDSRAVDPLIAQLKDKNVEVQCDVIEVLGHLEDRRATQPLIVILNTFLQNDDMDRYFAVEAYIDTDTDFVYGADFDEEYINEDYNIDDYTTIVNALIISLFQIVGLETEEILESRGLNIEYYRSLYEDFYSDRYSYDDYPDNEFSYSFDYRDYELNDLYDGSFYGDLDENEEL